MRGLELHPTNPSFPATYSICPVSNLDCSMLALELEMAPPTLPTSTINPSTVAATRRLHRARRVSFAHVGWDDCFGRPFMRPPVSAARLTRHKGILLGNRDAAFAEAIHRGGAQGHEIMGGAKLILRC